MYRNTETRSCNHCCSGKSINVTHCVCVCVYFCSLRYPACNAHAACFIVICPAPICNTVLHYLKNGTFSEKKLFNIKCVLTFCITFARSHSKSNWAIYDIKCILVSIWSTRYCHQISIKIEFSRQIFVKKVLKYQILWKPWSGGRVVSYGRTDGQACRSKYYRENIPVIKDCNGRLQKR